MPFRINPIMAGLIVALPNLVLAVEHGQITINDPSGATTIVLDPGDTVTHAGTGAAIDVSIAGNRLSADQAVITAGDAANGQTIGLRVSAGGAATLTGSTVSTVGAGQGAHALSATGAGSSIDARGTSVSTKETTRTGSRPHPARRSRCKAATSKLRAPGRMASTRPARARSSRRMARRYQPRALPGSPPESRSNRARASS